jgi:hypothetical protein
VRDNIFVGKPEDPIPLWILSGRWEDNIKTDITEIE